MLIFAGGVDRADKFNGAKSYYSVLFGFFLLFSIIPITNYSVVCHYSTVRNIPEDAVFIPSNLSSGDPLLLTEALRVSVLGTPAGEIYCWRFTMHLAQVPIL